MTALAFAFARRPSRGNVIARLRGRDLLAAIRADAPELFLSPNRVAAAERCVSLATRFLACRAVLVRHGALVVAARGDAADLVMTRYEGNFAVFGGEVLVVRVGSRAFIELCDPLDGKPFEAGDCAAMRVLGERYTVVLDALGVVEDAAEVARSMLER
jgi:hypothetical protein